MSAGSPESGDPGGTLLAGGGRAAVVVFCATIVTSPFVPGCGDGQPESTPDAGTSGPAIETEGTWLDGNGQTIAIAHGYWGASMLEEVDNDRNIAITFYPRQWVVGPEYYERLVWTEIAGDRFFYCTEAPRVDTKDAAKTSTNAADATDLTSAGCLGAPWIPMTRKK